MILWCITDLWKANVSHNHETRHHIFSQYCSAPKGSHLKSAYKVLHYLKGTIGLGLFYSATNDLVLMAITYANWGSCKDNTRSKSGLCMFLGTSLISWKSKKQDTVFHSLAESEYREMSFAVREVQWLVNMLREFDVPQRAHVPVFCDSTAAIHIANNAIFHDRTKHLESDCHKVRDMVKCGLIKTLHVMTSNQIADTFTKPLQHGLFHSLIDKMGLLSISSPA